MAEKAKIPSWRDMDWGQFLQHWGKRHSYPGIFDTTNERFGDDAQPIWFAIRSLHDRIHAGESEFDIPGDHLHLPPLDLEIQRQLEDLL